MYGLQWFDNVVVRAWYTFLKRNITFVKRCTIVKEDEAVEYYKNKQDPIEKVNFLQMVLNTSKLLMTAVNYGKCVHSFI